MPTCTVRVMPVRPYWIVTVLAGLRDAVDGLATPIGDDAARRARALGPRELGQRCHRGLARVRQLDGRAAAETATAARRGRARRLRLGRAACAGNLALPFGHGASLERPDAAQRHERAVAPGGVRHDELLGGPVAGQVRLAARQARHALGRRCRGDALTVTVEHGAVAELDRADVAGVLLGAVRRALNRDLRARREHLGGPAGAAQRRRGAQLALMRGLRAVRSRDVEVHPGMRVHEVDLRDDAGELDVLVHREVAETVVRAAPARQRDSPRPGRAGHRQPCNGDRVQKLDDSRIPLVRVSSPAIIPAGSTIVDGPKES